MIDTPTLTTARLLLRPLVRADAAALLPMFADPDTMRYWSRGPFGSEAELADYLVPDDGWRGRSWTIVDRADGGIAGRLAAVDQGDDICELGFLVAPDRQGRGLGTEAAGALIEHLFSADGVRRIFLDIDPDNAPSNRLAQKLGFTLEGRLREQWRTHIGIRDSLIWGLLAREWPGRLSQG